MGSSSSNKVQFVSSSFHPCNYYYLVQLKVKDFNNLCSVYFVLYL